MRLRQLEYLVAIWESGSFSVAASRLYVAQPSLSQQIRALEKELGAELLERGRHGLGLTPAGRAFLPHAKAVLEAAQEARDAVRDVVEGIHGDVHVLTVRSVASGILPSSIARWHSLYPATVLRLHDYSHRRDLEEAVRAGVGDLAIGPRPVGWSGPVVSLGFEELVVVSPAEFDADAPPAALEEMAASDWVLYEPEQGMTEVIDWLADTLGFAPRAVARTGQVAAALLLAIEGVGLALAPENAVPRGWSQHARRIGPGVYREIVAFCRDEPDQLTQRYLELLTAVELPLSPAEAVPESALRC